MLQKVVNQNLNNNIYASGIQNSPLAILIQECAFDGYIRRFVKRNKINSKSTADRTKALSAVLFCI